MNKSRMYKSFQYSRVMKSFKLLTDKVNGDGPAYLYYCLGWLQLWHFQHMVFPEIYFEGKQENNY